MDGSQRFSYYILQFCVQISFPLLFLLIVNKVVYVTIITTISFSESASILCVHKLRVTHMKKGPYGIDGHLRPRKRALMQDQTAHFFWRKNVHNTG